jgi:23S rRNA G2069 N7-methylase RlmK/C1962 C5-methylase RlmI
MNGWRGWPRRWSRRAAIWAVFVQPCRRSVQLPQCLGARHRAGRAAGQLIHTGFAGPDHPMLPQLAETGYLKALFFRLDG